MYTKSQSFALITLCVGEGYSSRTNLNIAITYCTCIAASSKISIAYIKEIINHSSKTDLNRSYTIEVIFTSNIKSSFASQKKFYLNLFISYIFRVHVCTYKHILYTYTCHLSDIGDEKGNTLIRSVINGL